MELHPLTRITGYLINYPYQKSGALLYEADKTQITDLEGIEK